MLAALSVLLGLVALLLAALLLALALPVRIAVAGRAGPQQRLAVELGLLGGLVPRIRLVDTTRAARRAAPPDEEPAGPRGGRTRRRRRQGLRRETLVRMLRAAPELILGELRRFRVERLRLDAAFGLGDPAATGEVYGWLCPLLYATPLRDCDVALRPDFTRAGLAAEGEAVVRFVPLALLAPALRFAWRVFVVRA